jgi:putative oxidoreductase
MRPVRTAARALLSAIFVYDGVRALANSEQYAPQAKRVTDRVVPLLEKADPRLPTDPRTLVKINGAVQVTSGLLLATGRLTRPAAALLAGTLLPTTVAAHPFWAQENSTDRRNHEIHFLKNLGLLGGLLLAAADTAGKPSLRWRADHLTYETRRSVLRAVRTARREAKIARQAVRAGRRLPH